MPALLPHDLPRDPLDPARHLGGGAARERHQQDAPRIGAVDDQMGDAVRQRVGLARAGAGDDEQRQPRRAVLLPDAVLDGPPLLRIEGLKVGGSHGQIQSGAADPGQGPLKKLQFLRVIPHLPRLAHLGTKHERDDLSIRPKLQGL